MVLQYLPAPAEALREIVRVTRPGGMLVVVDFARHEREWMREELGALRLGIDPEDVAGELSSLDCQELRVERLETPARRADLPGTFIASARAPERRP
jgi:ubiquinone/menaquinone biosynthesis C-methylase UbiE